MPTKEQEEFGRKIIETAKEAVRDIGWEDAAFACMFAHVNAFPTFGRGIPAKGAPGHTIVTDEKFQEAYQELLFSVALMAALLAEKTGQDLSKPPIGPN